MNINFIIHRLAQIAQQLDSDGHEPEATSLDAASEHLTETNTAIHSLLIGVVANLQKQGMAPSELLKHKGQDALRAELLRVLNQAKHHDLSSVKP